MLKNVFTAAYVNRTVLIMQSSKLLCLVKQLVLWEQFQKVRMVMKSLIFINAFTAENV